MSMIFCQGTLYLENNQRNVLHVGGIIETRIDVQFCVDTAGGVLTYYVDTAQGGTCIKVTGCTYRYIKSKGYISDNFLQIKEGGRCYWV